MEFSLENYFNFMFVRDPLQRLLSVYFNKAMNTNLTAIKNFGPDVKRRGLHECSKKLDRFTVWKIILFKVKIVLLLLRLFKKKILTTGEEMIAKQNRTRKSEKKSENRTLPTLEEFLEFILVSSMEGEIRFLTSINDVMASKAVGQRLCDDSKIELVLKSGTVGGRVKNFLNLHIIYTPK